MCTKVFMLKFLVQIDLTIDTDLSTTYLGQIDMGRDTEVKAEENFPITA